MSIQISAAEGTVPRSLLPDRSSRMLPAYEAADLRHLKARGWARVGVLAAIIDDRSRILMLDHKPSDKTPAGALGPLAETGQVAKQNGTIRVESASHTLARGIVEELGVSDPGRLKLTARTTGAWALNSWPVGVKYAEQYALGVCPVLHIGAAQREELLDTFTPTEGINGIAFMSPEDIGRHALVRPGTQDWLRDVRRSGLMQVSESRRSPVEFPDPAPLSGGTDIKFASISYL